MKWKLKLPIIILMILFLTMPFWPNPKTGGIPGNASAENTLVNPVGTNIIVEVTKQHDAAVVGVRSIQKQVSMRGSMPFNPFNPGMPGNGVPEAPQGGMGSGFFISPDGMVLTNHHVVDGADRIKVSYRDEKEYDAKLIGSDAKTDLALLQIVREPGDSAPLPYLQFGDSDKLEVGEWVIAIGNPFGLSHTVTTGIVSAKGRNIGSGPYDEFIQTDASINPGNSGGPLLNLQGKVVGINSAIISGGSGGNVGIGFAIPINMASQIVGALKVDGKVTRGWLGVMVQNITPELAGAFGLSEARGALVSDVIQGGPAFKGGIKRGDVIVAYGREAVDSVTTLPKLVAASHPGDTVNVEVIRDGKKEVVKITIDELQESKV